MKTIIHNITSALIRLENRLNSINAELRNLEKEIELNADESLQEKHFKLYKEKHLILKHIAIEIA